MKTRTNPGIQLLCLFHNPVAADVSPRHCPESAPAPASGCEVLKAALLCLTLTWPITGAAQTEKPSAAIPFAEIGAKATADYQGDALGISATADGARLRCGFQKLEGRVTLEGLWLESTAPGDGGRLRLVAASVSREGAMDDGVQPLWAGFDWSIPRAGAFDFCEPIVARHCGFDERASVLECGSPLPLSVDFEPSQSGRGLPHSKTLRERKSHLCSPSVGAANTRDGEDGVGRTAGGRLARTGTVEVADKLVRFIRPGVTEEYSVSVDGVRQDFVIESPPLDPRHPTLVTPRGELRVELALAGARAEAMAYGAKLKLEGSSRTLAYSRLRATDATGRELPARMEVTGRAGSPLPAGLDAETGGAHGVARPTLAICVDDADAVYPVRIDPTFSDEDWISMGGLPGANGIVHAATVDGSGNLYIGGEFTVVGNVLANRVAKWDGSGWSALGSGLDGTDPYTPAFVAALAVSGTNLYVGGYFTSAGASTATNVARWDGNSWSALGSGMNSSVLALAASEQQWPMSGSDLYAGGLFTTAGGTAANYVAKWDGSSWSALGTGVNSPVSALAVSGSALYVGGSFTMAGGSAANFVAKWDGSSWSALGSGIASADYQAHVAALAVLGSSLYVGGYFTSAGGVSANNVAKWNGSSWSALGSGVSHSVSAMVVSGSTLYVGGEVYMAGGSPANCVAKWSGGSWSALGSGVGNSLSFVSALAVLGTNLYVGGQFQTAGGSAAIHIANWNGSSWSALGSGMNNWVGALAVSGSDLYAGGGFSTVGRSVASHIANWNGSSWSALDSGMGGGDGYPSVYALAVSEGVLYAGGYFTTAGGSAVNRIAKWNGSNWSPLGSGMNERVYVLAVSEGVLYAGGRFTTAGGNAANHIAKWDGTNWSALDSGMNGYGVYALAVSGSDLYAGGDFTTAGGRAANYIAKWDGRSWSALGAGMDYYVYALAVSGGEVYAGGQFARAGGSAANHIAKWNGSSWSALGAGMNNWVSALAVSGSDLYAGGGFTTAGWSAAKYIAKWNGSIWSALGSGMNGSVSALAVSGSDLYAGGSFTTAGGKVSAFIARANLIPQRGVIQNLGVNGGTVALDCLGLPGTAFTVQRATDVLFTADLTTLLTTNAPAPDGLFRCTDSNLPSTTAFYRLLKQ